MSLNCLCWTIDAISFKKELTLGEYKHIKALASRVNSTTLYRWYIMLGGDMSYKDFYQEAKRMFYYDKYVCKHGVEYIYYIKFKQGEFNDNLPTDVIKVIKAIGGKNV